MSEKQGYRNACITLHQPWASLLVHGIKRIEGRSWPAPVRGRVWIHAAAKVPEPETIQAMEHFYREIYAVDGVTDVVFPEFYPTSVLLGPKHQLNGSSFTPAECQFRSHILQTCRVMAKLESLHW